MTVPVTDSFADLLHSARTRLLARRTPAGHWEGHLSSSALSTATAMFAMWMAQHTDARRHEGTEELRIEDSASQPAIPPQSAIHAALHWLITHQNPDGGWGDTVDSLSNISTTVLCWAALRAVDPRAARDAIDKAGRWLEAAAGSTGPESLIPAIIARYGPDKTFSVPILTMCALAGVLGKDPWASIPQLPFELAAFPQSWFRFLRLPVVSYALPALISMGLVRHRRRPGWNPIARLTRALVTARTLRVLQTIQPPGGGFLEAAPLTSFVAMSLIGAGHADHPVVHSALDFLHRTVRPDGSWPIDTNLATWVTTLSINALACDGNLFAHLLASQRQALRDWLIEQQYRIRHPYTGADPGGWAWTNLPGGVPDADDTAGALLALHHLGDIDPRTLDAACAGIRWLLDLQNADGGIPTFCRGWGRLPFDKSAAELTAHALLAFDIWRDHLPVPLRRRVDRATVRAIASLAPQQRPDGSFVPLWFGNQLAPDQENPTHGTARVLHALARPRLAGRPGVESMAYRAVQWLLAARHPSGGWGGTADVPPSIEETCQAVSALGAARDALPAHAAAIDHALTSALHWLQGVTQSGTRFPPAPIGLYFARLWYSEQLYPVIAVASLT